MSNMIYEAKLLGSVVRVYVDRVEYTPGFMSAPQSIPIGHIASIRQGTLTNKLTIETTGGRQVVIVTTKKRQVEEAIYRAQAVLRGAAPAPLTGPGWEPSPAPRSRVRTWLLIIGGAAFALAIIGALAGPKKDAETGGATENRNACTGEAARRAWLERVEARYDGASPRASGFRVTGTCSEKVVDRMLECTESAARGVHGDGPFLRDALALGFETYVCEHVGDDKRTEFPLASIVNR